MTTAKKPTAKTAEVSKTSEVAKTAVETVETAAKTVVETVEIVANKAAEAVGAAPMVDMLKPFSEMQEKVRASAEKGIEQLRAHYASFKDTAETATDKLEESMAAAQAGTRSFNLKVLDLIRLQSNAGLAHVQSLFAAKTIVDAVKLQQEFAKAQAELFQAHAKELADIAKKVATDVVEPVKDSMVLPFKR